MPVSVSTDTKGPVKVVAATDTYARELPISFELLTDTESGFPNFLLTAYPQGFDGSLDPADPLCLEFTRAELKRFAKAIDKLIKETA